MTNEIQNSNDKYKNKMKQNNGFTLLEVLIAALILVVAVAGIFSVFIFTKRSTNLPGSQFQALNFARQQAEDLRVDVIYPDYNADSGDLSTGYHGPESITIGSLPATRSYFVSNGPDSNGDGLPDWRAVTVTINWNEPTPP